MQKLALFLYFMMTIIMRAGSFHIISFLLYQQTLPIISISVVPIPIPIPCLFLFSKQN